jgi:hypothetical protein
MYSTCELSKKTTEVNTKDLRSDEESLEQHNKIDKISHYKPSTIETSKTNHNNNYNNNVNSPNISSIGCKPIHIHSRPSTHNHFLSTINSFKSLKFDTYKKKSLFTNYFNTGDNVASKYNFNQNNNLHTSSSLNFTKSTNIAPSDFKTNIKTFYRDEKLRTKEEFNKEYAREFKKINNRIEIKKKSMLNIY